MRLMMGVVLRNPFTREDLDAGLKNPSDWAQAWREIGRETGHDKDPG
jgi:hypothetical protein